MTLIRTAAAFMLPAILAGADPAAAGNALLQGGAYEVTYRLELPHVESWAVDKTTRICVPQAGGADVAPLPVLSGNNPLARCPARNIRRNGPTLRFDIACEGRDAARARAAYTLSSLGFKGRIAMVMGAKNMTMTEVQVGRRIGSCNLAGTPTPAVSD